VVVYISYINLILIEVQTHSSRDKKLLLVVFFSTQRILYSKEVAKSLNSKFSFVHVSFHEPHVDGGISVSL
jgi:hypothetical protein